MCLTSCKNNSDSDVNMKTNSEELTMNGVWKLASYYNYKDNQIVDTIKASDEYKQIKIYTKSKVMWSRYKEADSVDWFGYGDYFIKEDSLTEILDFGSKSMNKAIKEQKRFVFELKLNQNKFSQVQIDEEGNPIYAENYERIE
ncbi:hypothetical protein GCM10007962_30470 [Yeosuana aromativorans]|uniref:Lipocalin-like domain-containing protein n=2 Tax=Yeosuana aromativorans TaxID=288019 RepID=A0A8J3BT77_9FLAO|nr:hypothetical protein GCM10007962_30470 [Yeosuana aromativorans]